MRSWLALLAQMCIVSKKVMATLRLDRQMLLRLDYT